MKLVRFLLFPFAVLYDIITRIRNFLFDTGFFKVATFKTPVIIVGNLSVGGTGKTPQIEYLITLLQENNKVAVLSRGYKRKTKGFLVVTKEHTVKDVGDEPLQYFLKFNSITVAVDEDRVRGVQQLVKQFHPNVILLDDAYQHRKIKGSFSILLTKYNDLFVDDFLLPTGNLRESTIGAKRADVIVVTKCKENLSRKEQNKIKKKLKKFKKPVFFSSIEYNSTLSGFTNIQCDDLHKYEVLLVTGIANPTPLIHFLNSKNVEVEHIQFTDHHHFSINEVKDIKERYAQITRKNKILLTTEKDFTRLSSKIKELSYIKIKTNFLGNTNKEFNKIIMSHIEQNQQ